MNDTKLILNNHYQWTLPDGVTLGTYWVYYSLNQDQSTIPQNASVKFGGSKPSTDYPPDVKCALGTPLRLQSTDSKSLGSFK